MVNEEILNKKLIKLDNVCITPHIGGSTSTSIKKMGQASIKKIIKYVKKIIELNLDLGYQYQMKI